MQQIESFLRGKIANNIAKISSVPFDLEVSKWPYLTKWFITISPDTENEEIFYYDWRSWVIDWIATLTITKRWYHYSDNTYSVDYQREHTINDIYKWALNHVIINGKAELDDLQELEDNLTSTSNWKGASMIWIEDNAWNFTSADVEWALAELAVWAPWVADASETVAGKVEVATTVEFEASTDTWWTGAILVVKPSDIQDAITDVEAQLPTNASETVSWLVERATDTEASAWTDITKYMSPKQILDVTTSTWLLASDILRSSADNEVGIPWTAVYTKMKEIKIWYYPKWWTIRVKFDWIWVSWWNFYWQIYVNWVAIWTERINWTTTYVTYTEDISINDWDLVQIYCKCNIGWTYVKNNRIYYDEVSYWKEPTVILN